MPFRFKQFTIDDENSAHRVGTDSMILGAWSQPPASGKILDIGAGCGILSLMMAQKSTASIDAVEIDPVASNEALNNFIQSPWSSRLHLYNKSIQCFTESLKSLYDFIITNPPYFSGSLKSPVLKKNIARHDQVISLQELAQIANRVLKPEGTLALIIPFTDVPTFVSICRSNDLYLKRSLTVRSTPDKRPIRSLQEYSKETVTKPQLSELTLLDGTGKYSPEYLKLTREYHYF